MKKTAAFIFSLTVTACSLAVGSALADDKEAESPAVETTEELSTPPSETNSEEIYAPVIDKVKMRVENGFSSYSEENTGLYGVLLGDQSDLSYLWYIDPSITLDNAGYVITDLDGDGRDELAIGVIDEDGNGTIFDLYTQYEGNYYHIAAAGERNRFALTNRNTIVEEGSGGATSWGTVFYDIGKYFLEPSLGYSNNDDKHYIMESYTANEEDSIGYDFTWIETDEEELSYAYQPIHFTAFSAVEDEKVLIRAKVNGFGDGQIEGTNNGLTPEFDEELHNESIGFMTVKGRPVKLIAKADEGSEFFGWRNADTNEIISTDTELEFTAETPLNVNAVFSRRCLIKAEREGFGQLALTFDGSDPVFDPESEYVSVSSNALTESTVKISAKPDDGWEFVCWREVYSSEAYSTDSTLEIEVTEPLDLVAVFRPTDLGAHKISENGLVKWSVNDYQDKTGESASGKITGWSDEECDITLSDENGDVLDTYSVDPDTGIGTNSAGEAVDLPQTGMSGVHKAFAGLAAVMAVGGYALVRKS